MTTTAAKQRRLEYLRQELRAERISQGELLELQSLVAHIAPGDVELLEAAGVPEFPAEGRWPMTFSSNQRAMLLDLLWDSLLCARDKNKKTRRVTGWGAKTPDGLIACLERITFEEGEPGTYQVRVWREKSMWGHDEDMEAETTEYADAAAALAGFKDALARYSGKETDPARNDAEPDCPAYRIELAHILQVEVQANAQCPPAVIPMPDQSEGARP